MYQQYRAEVPRHLTLTPWTPRGPPRVTPWTPRWTPRGPPRVTPWVRDDVIKNSVMKS